MQQAQVRRLFSERFLWAFPIVYFVHLLDERFWGPGTASWATENGPLYFTNYAWLWVNVPSMIVFAAATWAVVRRSLPEWVTVGLATHLALHAFIRVAGTAVCGSVSPGVVTGILLCLPLAVPALVQGYRGLARRELRLGILVGVLSFQPLWHLLLHPLLPHGPPTS